jgi:hypothetical protein
MTTINIALVLLLQNISDLIDKVKLEWLPNHYHFTAKLKTANMTAVTDGILRSKDAKNIFGIMEAKKTIRRDSTNAIQMQETAEVVGWIHTSVDRFTAFNGQ